MKSTLLALHHAIDLVPIGFRIVVTVGGWIVAVGVAELIGANEAVTLVGGLFVVAGCICGAAAYLQRSSDDDDDGDDDHRLCKA